MSKLPLLFLVAVACSPQDILNRQGQSLLSKDYVQEGIDAKKRDDAKKEAEAQAKESKEAPIKERASRAQAHMDLFEYEAALADWKEAYRLSQEPAYLMKVGDTLRLTGDCVQAQDIYAQYQSKFKDNPEARTIQAKIDEAKQCQTRAGSNLGKIRQHYKDGTTHYDLAEYDAAAKDFKEAYRLSNDPAYLFNMAQAYRMGKNCGEAARFYEKFLAIQPDAPNKDKISARIVEMKACSKGR